MTPLLAKPRRTGREGKPLESLIVASQSRSTVLLSQVPQAARTIRTPRGPVVIRQRGPCDFFGIYIPDGKLVVLDAKESKNPNRLQTSEDHLAEHQRLELIRYGEAGAHAGLLCEATGEGKLYWCDWLLLQVRKPSIPWAEMRWMGSSSLAVQWAAAFYEAEGATR